MISLSYCWCMLFGMVFLWSRAMVTYNKHNVVLMYKRSMYQIILISVTTYNLWVAVPLYGPKRSNISKIEKESGVKFEHISAPRPDDIAKVVGGEAAEMITQVSDSVIPDLNWDFSSQ
ncbi:hypothetical protein VNO80_01196 [Phaseolus coccineus]|uniref:DDX21/DDX50 dimerisation domain-containing protein n=1 Tax=Phaseolus coccineus TaxID=3886 RepID=A0AAN9P0V5_PHACN